MALFDLSSGRWAGVVRQRLGRQRCGGRRFVRRVKMGCASLHPSYETITTVKHGYVARAVDGLIRPFIGTLGWGCTPTIGPAAMRQTAICSESEDGLRFAPP